MHHRPLHLGGESRRGCEPRAVETPGLAGAAVGSTSSGSWRSQSFSPGLAELGKAVLQQQILSLGLPRFPPLSETLDRPPAVSLGVRLLQQSPHLDSAGGRADHKSGSNLATVAAQLTVFDRSVHRHVMHRAMRLFTVYAYPSESNSLSFPLMEVSRTIL